MTVLPWLAITAIGFLAGVALLQYLTVHPLRMSLYLFLTCSALFAGVVLLVSGFQGAERLVAALLFLATWLAGYAWATKQLLDREDTRPVPQLTRVRGDPGDGHLAVVYFTHGEPETYDPIGWINQFRELDEQGIPFVPFLARPLFIYQLRNKYLTVGMSHHRQMHLRMLRRLEEAYRREGDATTRFYISFLDDDPRPDAAVIQALNDGASHIVVSEVFLSISNHTAEGKELIETVGVEEYGSTLWFTGPLWDSEFLQRMPVTRANAHIGDSPRSKVGVLLVGHGQPDQWDEEWPTETEHELRFRQEALRLFVEDGYKHENVSLAWMEFKKPEPAEKIAEFRRNGVEKVVYFSAAISAESLHSQFDVPALVHKGNHAGDLSLLNLGAWNDDPLVIRAIKDKIDTQRQRLAAEVSQPDPAGGNGRTQ